MRRVRGSEESKTEDSRIRGSGESKTEGGGENRLDASPGTLESWTSGPLEFLVKEVSKSGNRQMGTIPENARMGSS